MSAIFGLFRRDGEPLDPTYLPRMRDALTHRGPDGLNVWQHERVGLGHAMLATTAADSAALPLHAYNIVVTCDSRLDNRAELCEILALPFSETLPDAEIIAAAYARWGDDFPAKLDGAFAIAIWDAARHTLICVRDHLGQKPFYFYASPQVFAFATEIKGILAQPLTPNRVNETRIADYLLLRPTNIRQTFYDGIYRLPAAHRLLITPQAVQETAYWQLPDRPSIAQGSDEELIAQFRSLFMSAMQANMRASTRIGSLLSGGMDSSAITVAARHLLPASQPTLPTFTAIAPSIPEIDETAYVHSIVTQDGYEPHFFHSDEVGPFYQQERMLYHMEEPMLVGTLFMTWGATTLAQQDGVRVMLLGNGGDEVVSHGFGYLSELAYSQQWDRFNMEFVQSKARLSGFENDPLTLYYKYGFPVITRFMREARPLAAARAINTLSRATSIPRKRLIKKYILRPLRQALRKPPESTEIPGLPPEAEFAQRVGFLDRFKLHYKTVDRLHPTSQWEDQYNAVTLGMMPQSFETVDRLGAAFSIEMRQPFVNRTLLEYSLTVPGHLKLRSGMTRYILREALRDMLPELNYGRLTKSNLSSSRQQGMMKYEAQWLSEALRNSDTPLAAYIDVPKCRALIDEVLTHPHHSNSQLAWYLLSLERWLKMQRSLT